MQICGLQKLAMVDYPGKLAATVFTGGCNLRCPFCHNALLVTQLAENPERHSVEEVLAFLKPMLDVFHVETEESVEELSGPSELTKHTPIEDMYLSVRSYNCLKRYGVDTVEDLIDACEHPEDLLKVRNLGRKSLQEIINKLFLIAGVDYRGEFGF